MLDEGAHQLGGDADLVGGVAEPEPLGIEGRAGTKHLVEDVGVGVDQGEGAGQLVRDGRAERPQRGDALDVEEAALELLAVGDVPPGLLRGAEERVRAGRELAHVEGLHGDVVRPGGDEARGLIGPRGPGDGEDLRPRVARAHLGDELRAVAVGQARVDHQERRRLLGDGGARLGEGADRAERAHPLQEARHHRPRLAILVGVEQRRARRRAAVVAHGFPDRCGACGPRRRTPRR